MIRKFEEKQITELYSKFRPRYTTEVAEKVVAYARKNKSNGKLLHLVDVGCGSGQSTEAFKSYFEKITAVDVSANQILEAKKNPNSQIIYLVSAAESLPVEENTVDVVCAGTAAHWFNLPKFWIECRRVLKKDGSLVLFGYGPDTDIVPAREVPSQLDKKVLVKETGMLIKKFFDAANPSDRIELTANHYADIFDMLPSSSKCRDDATKIIVHWSLERLRQYYMSLTPYQENERGPELLQQMTDGMKKIYGLSETKDDEIPLIITFNVFMLFSRRPAP